MKVILDAAGGPGASSFAEAALRARRELGVECVLAGPEDELKAALGRLGPSAGVELHPSGGPVALDEDPVRACRERPDASVMAAAALAAQTGAPLVSAGHPGAAMTAALWHLKRLPGVLRPASAALIPTPRGATVLMDAGAQADCRPWHLLQSAVMGSLYAEQVLGLPSPKVALLSNGGDAARSGDLVREALPLIKYGGFAFAGLIDGAGLARGEADVVVCDGLTGGVAASLSRGSALTLLAGFNESLGSGWAARLGAWLLADSLHGFRSRWASESRAAGPLLGVGGPVVLADPRSNAAELVAAVRMARDLAAADACGKIRAALEKMKSTVELSKAAK